MTNKFVDLKTVEGWKTAVSLMEEIDKLFTYQVEYCPGGTEEAVSKEEVMAVIKSYFNCPD